MKESRGGGSIHQVNIVKIYGEGVFIIIYILLLLKTKLF
jgi:hypothetical protein